MTITDAGKVGINESNPATTLELSAGTNKNLNVWSSGAYATGITIGSANDAFSAYTPIEFRGSEFYFHNGTAEKLRITSAGKVGIGTNDPKQPVSIVKGRVNVDIQGDYYGVWFDGDSTGENTVGIDVDALNDLASEPSEKMTSSPVKISVALH